MVGRPRRRPVLQAVALWAFRSSAPAAAACVPPSCFCDAWCANLASQGVQRWMDDFNDAGRPGAIDYWASSGKHPPFAQGRWEWLDFNPPGSSDPAKVQLLYASPMGRTCTHNLTVHLASGMEQCTRSRGSSWNWGTWHMANCTMHMAAWATRTVDRLNAGAALPGRCLQLTVTPYDAPAATGNVRHSEILNACNLGPAKHAMILTGVDGEMALESSVLLNTFGVPHLSVNAVTGGAEHFYDRTKFPLTVQLWPRWRDSVLQFLLKAASDRVAFVRQDNQICNSAAQVLVPMAARRNISVVLTSIIQYDSTNLPGNWAAAAAAVAALQAANARYIWYCGDAPLMANLLCEASRADFVGPHVQWMAVGSLAFSAITLTAPTNGCTLPQMVTAAESGGFLWAMYTTGFSFLPYLDQLLVPQSDAAIDLTGAPWPEDGSRNLPAAPTHACRDDEAALNAVADDAPEGGFRSLLQGGGAGGQLSCRDIVRGGFCDAPLTFASAAALCPVACCADNKYSYGCRTSCACTAPASVTDLRGNTLCTAESWRLPEAWFSRPAAEVKSWSPRQLDALPPNRTQWQANQEVMAMVDSEPRRSQLGDASKNGLMFFNSCYYSDGLTAFYLAFQCLTQLYGEDAWEGVAARNESLVAAVVDVCLQKVDFHGFSGLVSFSGNARRLGTAFMDVWNARWSNQLFKRDPSGKPFVGGIYNFLGGVIGNTSVLALRDFGRNSTSCHGQANRALVLDACPGPPNSFLWDWTQANSTRNVPLSGPSVCPPGQYPLAVGEAADAMAVDSCAPCRPGTSKGGGDRKRCNACPAGFFQPAAGQTACLACPRGTISPPPVITTVGRYHEELSVGAVGCSACPAGEAAELAASTRCTPCTAGTYTGAAASPLCERCPRGEFQAAAGATACQPCPLQRSTLGSGALSAAECTCPAGTELLADGACAACPEHCVCPGGERQHEVLSLERYYLSVPEGSADAFFNGSGALRPVPVRVPLAFKCTSREACPGNKAPGDCPPGYSGLACGTCLEGYSPGAWGCVKCHRPLDDPRFGGALLAGMIVLACGLMLLAYPVVNSVETVHTGTLRLTAFVLGIGMNTAMILSLLQRLPIQWPAILSGPQTAFRVLFFDSDVLRLSCFMHQRPVDRVLIKFWVPIAVIGLHVGVGFLASLRWTCLDKMVNCIGYFMTALFLPFAMNALEIFNCYSHPPPNHKSSVVRMPSVLCYEREWTEQLLPWGTLGLLVYPLGMGSLIAYLTWKAPALISANPRWSWRCKFIYTRFRYDCWWWGLLLMARDAGLSVFVTIVAGNAYAQTLLVVTVLVAYQQLLLRFRPWRTELQLQLDAALVFLVTVVMVCGASFAEDPPRPFLGAGAQTTSDWQFISATLHVAIVLAGVVLLGGTLLSLQHGNGDRRRHSQGVRELLGVIRRVSAHSQSAFHQFESSAAVEANASRLLALDMAYLRRALEYMDGEVFGSKVERPVTKIKIAQPSDATCWAGAVPRPLAREVWNVQEPAELA